MKGFNHGSTTDDDLLYDFTMNYLYSQDYAADIDQLSARYFDDNEQFNGAEHIFPKGYSQIINVLSQNLEILYEKIVTDIDYSKGFVTVKTKDGSLYEADKVIVTVPLGVLQSGSIIFTPALPSSKTAAIQRLGFGLMDKVWLEFSEAFWKNDEKIDWINYVSDTPGVFVQTLNVNKYLDRPLIVMFNVGEVARLYSNMTDEEVLSSAMQVIRQWYPDAPDYVRYARSNWSQDPFARGSYSFLKAGASPGDCDIYAESISQIVFFAGEATFCDMIGTVHGAYISGVDAANFAVLGDKYKQQGFQDRYSEEESSSDSYGESLAVVLPLVFWF
jgi:monoamine oxidase